MVRITIASVLIVISSATNCHWNLYDKLSPPHGTGWRGAVVDDTRFSSVKAWEEHYGFPLHLKRVFKGNNWQSLTPDEITFVKHGGIILYTVPIRPPLKFTDFNNSEGAWRIKQFAHVIGSVAPAKVMVSLRYEPSLWVDPSKPEHYVGSPAEYRAMWKAFAHGFEEANVKNVVWAMDYSTRATHEEYHPVLAALWPNDVQIDWLFFNMFQYGTDKKRSWLDMFDAAYSNFTALSNVHQTYMGQEYKANYLSAPNWGLGAWGADVKSGTEKQRAQFIEDSAKALNTAKYPRMKGQVYFDTYDANTDTGSIIKGGQKAAYHDLNSINLFTMNDCEAHAIVV